MHICAFKLKPTYACIHADIYTHTLICVYVYMCICTFVHVYIYVYMYIYKLTHRHMFDYRYTYIMHTKCLPVSGCRQHIYTDSADEDAAGPFRHLVERRVDNHVRRIPRPCCRWRVIVGLLAWFVCFGFEVQAFQVEGCHVGFWASGSGLCLVLCRASIFGGVVSVGQHVLLLGY